MKERGHLEDLDIERKIILKWISMKKWEEVDCVHLTQDWHKLSASMNMVMKCPVP
jgi:DNA-binding MltR family transcriptional regulator